MSCDENHTAKIRPAKLAILPGDAGDSTTAEAGHPRLWKSLAAFGHHPAIAAEAAREFPPGSSEWPDDGVSRRTFVQLLGASLAAAGVAGCKKPPEKIVPYTRRPPEIQPGNALHYATATLSRDGYALGILAEANEGRPTKLEGNPDHPDSLGGLGVQEQASIQMLYDPNRARQPRWRGKPVSWREVHQGLAMLGERAKAEQGARLRFLIEPTTSPLVGQLRTRILQALPQARFFAWSATASDAALEGARLAFGRPLETRLELDRAQVIVALDADLLNAGPGALRNARGFGAHREPGPEMNRLYVAEPTLTPTGMAADHRLRVRASQVGDLVVALCAELGRAGMADLATVGTLGRTAPPPAAVKWAAAAAKDLVRTRGRCVVATGPRQPVAVQALVHAINAALGNVGNTVVHHAPLHVEAETGVAGLRALADDIKAGKVETLVVTARNPIYTAPADLGLPDLLRKVPHVIYLALFEDETAPFASTFLPALHELETWGDGRATDGTASIMQPLIAPLHGGLSDAELVAGFLGESHLGAHKLVREFWKGRAGGPGFDQSWEKWLRDGVVQGTGAAAEIVQAQPAALAGTLPPLFAKPAPGLELVFAPCGKVGDGRLGNNAWLQELPDSVSKLTWDNAAYISPATAKRLGIEAVNNWWNIGDTEIVSLRNRGREVSAPVYVMPGLADDTVLVHLGYGREGAESVAQGVGFAAGTLRGGDALWIDGVDLGRTGKRHRFSITQDHWTMEGDPDPKRNRELDRHLALEVKAGDLGKDKALEENRVDNPTIHAKWDRHKDQLKGGQKIDYAWGMAIDLGKCTGCTACVIACVVENNIPVAGKANVWRGREMQWLRIDRYFMGDDMDDPGVINQPVACVHCEAAPCEYVCPVNATVHSDEGMNEMVYNRCIGTRYCSNNCPYKVRRFNFLDYHGDLDPVSKMRMNPDVTVRSRGVMEKCTYCVQRVERRRIDARIEGRLVADQDIQTACQQTCPTRAIEFGNLNDPQARVSKMQADERSYKLLNELNTRPRTQHMARIRNLNPELA